MSEGGCRYGPRTAAYAGACLAVVAAGTLAAGLLLDGPGLTGVLAAAAVALPVQVGTFAVLARFRPGTQAFTAAWAGGTLVRMAVVAVAGWALVALPDLPPAPTLLGLAAFFFMMLLLESRFLGLGGNRAMLDQGSR